MFFILRHCSDVKGVSTEAGIVQSSPKSYAMSCCLAQTSIACISVKIPPVSVTRSAGYALDSCSTRAFLLRLFHLNTEVSSLLQKNQALLLDSQPGPIFSLNRRMTILPCPKAKDEPVSPKPPKRLESASSVISKPLMKPIDSQKGENTDTKMRRAKYFGSI
jgi:hypothetical protein